MLSDIRNVYFSGINGIGMSGLAKILVKEGYNVAGSDLERKNITQEMEDMGIKIYIGQTEENVKDKGIDLFVYSTAIRETNPEYMYIVKNGIKKIKRGQLLAQLMNRFEGIAIAGTHGKTTTSSMMSVAFLEKDPTIVVGGIIPEIQSNSKIGNSEYFIVEPDHLEHHGTYENIKKSFEKFIDSTEKLAILCKDCEDMSTLNLHNKNIIWYSVKREDVHIFATNISVKNGCTHYEVIKNGKNLGEFTLCIPGEHNVANSLPVIYLADELGCNIETVKERLAKFKGANRRYQVIYDKDLRIIDDYAHHPTEIKVTIEAAKANEKGDVTVIFQPHRYSRTKFFFDDFIKSLKKADELILMPIYSAGEDNTYGVSSEELAEKIGNGVKVYTEEEIQDLVKSHENSNRSYVFMGAGSVSKLAHQIKSTLK